MLQCPNFFRKREGGQNYVINKSYSRNKPSNSGLYEYSKQLKKGLYPAFVRKTRGKIACFKGSKIFQFLQWQERATFQALASSSVSQFWCVFFYKCGNTVTFRKTWWMRQDVSFLLQRRKQIPQKEEDMMMSFIIFLSSIQCIHSLGWHNYIKECQSSRSLCTESFP